MRAFSILLLVLIAACSTAPAKDQRTQAEITNQTLEDIALAGRVSALERRLDEVEKRKPVTIVAASADSGEGRNRASSDLVESLKRHELETRLNDLETARRLDSYRR